MTADHISIGPFDRTILNALSAHIAILDRHGVILETNLAWRQFGVKNGLGSSLENRRINYLEVCDAATGVEAEHSRNAARGIREVIRGDLAEFAMEYPCHSPAEQMWFYMRVTRIPVPGPHFLVISHENITPLKLAEETIRRREMELRLKTQDLEEANTALKVLLRHREEDKQEIEEKIVINVKRLVLAHVEKLKQTRLDARQRMYLEIMESHLMDIISPFLQKMSTLNLRLTPQEIQVAALVKAGRNTKEMAEMLNVSTNAIDFHRKNIRKKLGLNNRKTNLQSYLMSMS
ncbi:MAG: response regulator transcription factor [Thermodesulfobacteriota bacterium]